MINKVIFSVFQKGKSNDENLISTTKIMTLLNKTGVEFQNVEGCYKGTKELFFVLDLRMLPVAKELAVMNNRESILTIDTMGDVMLHYMPVTLEQDLPLGKFISVSKEVALAQDAYTYDLKGTYYICSQNELSELRV